MLDLLRCSAKEQSNTNDQFNTLAADSTMRSCSDDDADVLFLLYHSGLMVCLLFTIK